LQRTESLAAERIALDEADLDRQRPWLAAEKADDDRESVRHSLIDRIVMGIRRLDHIAEAGKTCAGEGFDS
jgi:hypothetical protein